MSPLQISLVVTLILWSAGFVGAWLRGYLPAQHLDGDTRDMAKVCIGFITTLSALVLGLMLGSAKGSYDRQSVEVQTVAAKVTLLDYSLRELGTPAEPARVLLTQFVSGRMLAIWGGEGGTVRPKAFGPTGFRELKDAVEAINPPSELDHTVWLRALQLVDDMAQLRALAVTGVGSAITFPLLVLLVFWLSMIALGLNLFAPRNLTVVALNFVCALCGTGAIYLILQMDQPFSGPVRISAAPLRAAVEQLSQ